jgi:hypothetical protein
MTVMEPALWDLPNEGHSRPFEDPGCTPTGKLSLPLVATTRRLTTPRSGTASDPKTTAVFVDALIDVIDLHRIALYSKPSEHTNRVHPTNQKFREAGGTNAALCQS